MSFTETQLTTWSNQGATVTSALTYNSIKTCIEGISWKDDISYDIYLQGSYKNFTNIRGNSDVDVVIEFTSVFYSNKRNLSEQQLKEFDEHFSDGKYTLDSFKKAIVEALQGYYGNQNVKVGNRSIRVIGANGRLDADVICCAEYREYASFSKSNPNNYVAGVTFWETVSNNQIINFPKQHFDNGASKNSNASGNYKPVVRIYKNMRSVMVSNGLILPALSPSYFMECMMYSVPNSNYSGNSYQSIIVNSLNYLNNATDSQLDAFVCQNQQRYLFGSSGQQWNKNDYRQFISRLIDFWNAG